MKGEFVLAASAMLVLANFAVSQVGSHPKGVLSCGTRHLVTTLQNDSYACTQKQADVEDVSDPQ